MALFALKYRNKNYRQRCHFGGQNQALIIAMCHDEGADHPGAHPPTSGIDQLLFPILILEGNIKSPCKVLSKIMRGSGL